MDFRTNAISLGIQIYIYIIHLTLDDQVVFAEHLFIATHNSITPAQANYLIWSSRRTEFIFCPCSPGVNYLFIFSLNYNVPTRFTSLFCQDYIWICKASDYCTSIVLKLFFNAHLKQRRGEKLCKKTFSHIALQYEIARNCKTLWDGEKVTKINYYPLMH